MSFRDFFFFKKNIRLFYYDTFAYKFYNSIHVSLFMSFDYELYQKNIEN